MSTFFRKFYFCLLKKDGTVVAATPLARCSNAKAAQRVGTMRLCRLIFAPAGMLLPSVRAGLALSGQDDPPAGETLAATEKGIIG